jgi:hypothetical protein
VSSIEPNKQPTHVPPYYFITQDQEQRLQAMWMKRSGGRRGLRSLFSRRSAQR